MGPGARRDRRPHRHRHPGGPPRRGHVPRRPARRRQLHRAGPARLGPRRPQLAHQHLLVGGPGRLRVVDGLRPALTRLRQRRVIFLISSHLEAGHYFNPHAQRIIEGKQNGATVICVDPRLSNTASMVDHWLPAWPGTEPVLLLAHRPAAARGRDLGPRVRAPLGQLGDVPPRRPGPTCRCAFESVGPGPARPLRRLHAGAGGRAVRARRRADPRDRRLIGGHARPLRVPHLAGRRRRQPGRLADRALPVASSTCSPARWAAMGGTSPNGWNKFIPVPPKPVHPHDRWNELTWPIEYPLAHHEMSMLLPHFLKEGRGRLDTYFTRVYNPVWTNPDGFSLARGADRRGAGRLPRRPDADRGRRRPGSPTTSCRWASAPSATTSPPTRPTPGGGSASASRCSAVFAEQQGRTVDRTWEVNPGEVWEENEFWIDLALPHRPRRQPRHPRALRVSDARPASRSASTSTTSTCSPTPCPACPRPPPRRA